LASAKVQEGRKIGRDLASASFRKEGRLEGIGLWLGSGRSENRKELRLRMIGKPEGAQTSVLAQEDRKTRKGTNFGFGSRRSENQKELRLRSRLRTIGKPERVWT